MFYVGRLNLEVSRGVDSIVCSRIDAVVITGTHLLHLVVPCSNSPNTCKTVSNSDNQVGVSIPNMLQNFLAESYRSLVQKMLLTCLAALARDVAVYLQMFIIHSFLV